MAANAGENPEQGISAGNLLPLDARELEVLVIIDQMVVRHVFRRITQADWMDYFTSAAGASECEDGTPDMTASGLALYRRAILRVEGYQTRSGRAPETLPSWPECISQEDRLAAIDLLLKTFWVFASESFTIDKNGREISFEIPSSDGKPGPMRRYFSVVHRFRPPTEKQSEQFFLARAMHRNHGESAFTVLLSLYDELIQSVEGYSVSGRELRGREEVAREMDAFHKSVAMGVLLDCDALKRAVSGKKVAVAIDAIGPKTFAGLESGKVLH